jgi:hypothetical protein
MPIISAITTDIVNNSNVVEVKKMHGSMVGEDSISLLRGELKVL